VTLPALDHATRHTSIAASVRRRLNLSFRDGP